MESRLCKALKRFAGEPADLLEERRLKVVRLNDEVTAFQAWTIWQSDNLSIGRFSLYIFLQKSDVSRDFYKSKFLSSGGLAGGAGERSECGRQAAGFGAAPALRRSVATHPGRRGHERQRTWEGPRSCSKISQRRTRTTRRFQNSTLWMVIFLIWQFFFGYNVQSISCHRKLGQEDSTARGVDLKHPKSFARWKEIFQCQKGPWRSWYFLVDGSRWTSRCNWSSEDGLCSKFRWRSNGRGCQPFAAGVYHSENGPESVKSVFCFCFFTTKSSFPKSTFVYPLTFLSTIPSPHCFGRTWTFMMWEVLKLWCLHAVILCEAPRK